MLKFSTWQALAWASRALVCVSGPLLQLQMAVICEVAEFTETNLVNILKVGQAFDLELD